MHDLFKNNAYRVLELFMDFPSKDFSIREIARLLKLSHSVIIVYVSKLLKLGLIKKKIDTLYPVYFADVLNADYINYKKNYVVFKIFSSGLITFLSDKTFASSIVLFGSSAKGSYSESSDIDIFVEAKEQRIDCKKYEKILGRNINLLFETKLISLSEELRNNVLNGTVLYGFVKIDG